MFAHNEESSIALLLRDLANQTLLRDRKADRIANVRICVLCNGCKDGTVDKASVAIKEEEILSGVSELYDFQQGGKARTWNRFVEELPSDFDCIVFMDGDIRLPDSEALKNLIEELEVTDACAVTSEPRKNLACLRRKPLLYRAAKTIVRKHVDGPICGQLYAVKASEIRGIRLPVPCLVDDGFLSACLITGLFLHQGTPERVRASHKVWHLFEPPSSFREFFRHDVRMALGVELNAALYTDLWAAESLEERFALLTQFAGSEGIEQSISNHLLSPEKSALKRRGVMKRAFGNNEEGIAGRLARFPLRFVHGIYMALVRRRARHLFRQRQFEW